MGAKWEPKGAKRMPKGVKGAQRAPFAEQERESEEFGARRVHQPSPFGSHFGPKSMKNGIENSFKNQSRKSMEKYAKRLQNGVQIDAKTHQKTMPKVRAKKGVSSIERRGFLEG